MYWLLVCHCRFGLDYSMLDFPSSSNGYLKNTAKHENSLYTAFSLIFVLFFVFFRCVCVSGLVRMCVSLAVLPTMSFAIRREIATDSLTVAPCACNAFHPLFKLFYSFVGMISPVNLWYTEYISLISLIIACISFEYHIKCHHFHCFHSKIRSNGFIQWNVGCVLIYILEKI